MEQAGAWCHNSGFSSNVPQKAANFYKAFGKKIYNIYGPQGSKVLNILNRG